jgi:hypothetical protein
MQAARAFLPLLAALLFTAGSRSPGGPDWLADPDEAFALAAETGRPLLLVFR